jgi:hypothetical protein
MMKMRQSKFHRDIDLLTTPKKWGIKIQGKWWVQSADEDAIYTLRRDAVKDATDFNSMRKTSEAIYTVEEYVPRK